MKTKRIFLLAGVLSGLITCLEGARPNILWIVVEDMSPHFGCYRVSASGGAQRDSGGETTIATPHVDGLAAEGVQFENAFVTAPVCSTARSAMITGMYQTTIGAHHHRSGRGAVKLRLPEGVRTLPEMFKEAGYWVSNGRVGQVTAKGKGVKAGGIAKTDYNFETPADLYDAPTWDGRADGQPFFAQVQLSGGKARATATKKMGKEGRAVSPAEVELPPYYPDDPVMREDWAEYLNSVMLVDDEVGEIVEKLKAEGVYQNTTIFFLTDHGISHARGKQFCYEEGIRVPLIVRGPGAIGGGSVREDLVVHIDIAATSLRLAGIEIPSGMEARPLFGEEDERKFVVSARDRCDETVDRIRSVRTAGLKYIRNGYPMRPHLQPCAYKDNKEILKRIRAMDAAGELEGPELVVTVKVRPKEEFYDLAEDPWELKNLAQAPGYAEQLKRHRAILDAWIEETGDKGQAPEPWEVYDSDMEAYVNALRKLKPERAEEVERNIAWMKAMAAEGR